VKKPQPQLSLETRELRDALAKATRTIYPGTNRSVGTYTCGVYAFFDYDGEPIYVGQTYEGLSSRIGRHLTNQRTDAVAMSVLDPFEVCWVEFYPLVELDRLKDANAKRKLAALELAVFTRLVAQSSFGAILNEAIPASVDDPVEVPEPLRVKIVTPNVETVRAHPDVRLARRAQTIARLAQIISERKVSVGLRKTLTVQARRLVHLADAQFAAWGGEDAVVRKMVGEDTDDGNAD
jgi:hypothetical protein